MLIVRRAEPGQATLDGLVASGLLDRPTADLLRLGARSRLNMLVSGPSRQRQDRRCWPRSCAISIRRSAW